MSGQSHTAKFKSVLVVLTAATVVTLLTSCSSASGSSPTSNASESPSAEAVVVYKGEFESAVSLFKIESDEFDGSGSIFPISPASILESGVRHGRNFGSLSISAGKDKGEKNYQFTLGVTYLGSDWLFFDSVDLKSSTGTMNLEINSSAKTEDVLDGGNVSEIGLVTLSDSQIRDLTELTNGTGLKFRINGSGDKAGEDFSGSFTPWMKKVITNGLVIANGLKEGFLLPN
jgi:hypothetical protein